MLALPCSTRRSDLPAVSVIVLYRTVPLALCALSPSSRGRSIIVIYLMHLQCTVCTASCTVLKPATSVCLSRLYAARFHNNCNANVGMQGQDLSTTCPSDFDHAASSPLGFVGIRVSARDTALERPSLLQ
jgi:hypothetical protein